MFNGYFTNTIHDNYNKPIDSSNIMTTKKDNNNSYYYSISSFFSNIFNIKK